MMTTDRYSTHLGVQYWVPIILQAVLIIGAMIGVWIANDRRMTILEQQVFYMDRDVKAFAAISAKLTENQTDVIRSLDRVTILMDLYLGPKSKGGK